MSTERAVAARGVGQVPGSDRSHLPKVWKQLREQTLSPAECCKTLCAANTNTVNQRQWYPFAHLLDLGYFGVVQHWKRDGAFQCSKSELLACEGGRGCLEAPVPWHGFDWLTKKIDGSKTVTGKSVGSEALPVWQTSAMFFGKVCELLPFILVWIMIPDHHCF